MLLAFMVALAMEPLLKQLLEDNVNSCIWIEDKMCGLTIVSGTNLDFTFMHRWLQMCLLSHGDRNRLVLCSQTVWTISQQIFKQVPYVDNQDILANLRRTVKRV